MKTIWNIYTKRTTKILRSNRREVNIQKFNIAMSSEIEKSVRSHSYIELSKLEQGISKQQAANSSNTHNSCNNITPTNMHQTRYA